jgi:hypothetical protein
MFGWIFELLVGDLPGFLWPLLAGAGVACYFFSAILGSFPTFKPYTMFIKPVSLAVAAFGVFMFGGSGISAIYQQQIEDMKAKIAIAEQASKDTNVQIQTKIVTNTKIIHDKQIVIQEKIVKDSAKIDTECKLAPEAIADLNSAAKNPLGVSK